MEYILLLLSAVLVGLILSRKLSQAYQLWGNCYWIALGICIVQSVMFSPYRLFRVLHDLGNLLG